METKRELSCNKRSVPLCCLLRESGSLKNSGGPCKNLQVAAEEILISKNHEEFTCALPEGTRSTFLIVFSPDGKLIASTHGNHNVYVTELTNGRHVKTLIGHPRTPWCIAFHPSSNQILASGCLGGQVRVWDLHGGSELWSTDSHTVIASLAFHPIDRVLVIASYNEIHFWDWSQQKPFAKCCTSNEREKVRYVAFDGLGEKLVTGISNAPRFFSQWDRVSAPQPPPLLSQVEHERRITICYRYMVEQYEQLIQRYFQLRRENRRDNSPSRRPRPNTTDRGTDPMESIHMIDGRCHHCRCTNPTNSAAGPSTPGQNHHSAGVDEVSASHSSSEYMPDTPEQVALSRRANYLFTRLHRLRSQVERETGRDMFREFTRENREQRERGAAVPTRTSPSAPEDSDFFLDMPTSDSGRSESNTSTSHLTTMPEPMLPRSGVRPGHISRSTSSNTRRPLRFRISDSSSSDTSLSDNTPAYITPWQRPLTPPPSQSQRLTTRLNSPFSARVVFDQVETPASLTQGNNNATSSTSHNPSLWARHPRASESTSMSSRSVSEPTNGSDSETENLMLSPDMDNNNYSHWRVFLRYRYFRDSGSNTEPPSDSNSSSNIRPNPFRRNFLHASAIARLRAQFRRLQSDYRDCEPQVLRSAADSAERRLVDRLSVLQGPFPSTSSASHRFPAPQGTDLSGVRLVIHYLGRHVENLMFHCSASTIDVSDLRSNWNTLEENIFTIFDSVRDSVPVVCVSPGNQVDTEGVASTSSLPTDEESEDSGSYFTFVGRRSLGPRRFRFLHRPAYKRPRIDRVLRLPRRNLQDPSPDDDSDENEEGPDTSRRRGSSDGGDNRGLKRKTLCDPLLVIPPHASEAPSTSNSDPIGRMNRPLNAGPRVRGLGVRHPFRSPAGRSWAERVPRDRPERSASFQERTTRPPHDDSPPTMPRFRGGINVRTIARLRARHVFLLMIDSLTQFFYNESSPTVSLERLRTRLRNFTSLVELALNLSEVMITQLEFHRNLSRSNRPDNTTPPRLNLSSLAWPRRTRMAPRHYDDISMANRADSMPILPVLRVNDGPVPQEPPSSTLRESPPHPALSPFRPRYLHPRYVISGEDSSEESSQDRNEFYFLRSNSPTVLLSDATLAPHHRIQVWDFSKYKLPEIHLADKNIVVKECKIHNDASVDISADGKLLVTLLPCGRLSITTMLGIYSMEWDSLGQCLYTTHFDQNAVSVSLSPTTRHLVVGLSSRRVHFFHNDRFTIAQVFKLEGGNPSKRQSKGKLVLVRDLEMARESTESMSINCIRWAPSPGEAFIYGTNTGKVKILR